MLQRGQQERRTWIGLAWIAGLLTLALLIFFADRVRQALKDTTSVVVLMPNAPNISPGDPVRVAGLTAGRVKKVDFAALSRDTTARMAATVEIADDAFRRLRVGTTAVMVSPVPMADPLIDIIPTERPGPQISPGDTLRGAARTELWDVRNRVVNVAVRLDSLMAAVDSMQAAAGPGGLGPRVGRVMASAEAARAEASTLAASIRASPLPGALQTTPAAVADIRLRLGEITSAFRERASRFDTITTGVGADTVALSVRFRRLAGRGEQIQANLAEIQRMMNEGQGLPGRMARDSALEVAMRGVQAQIDSLIADVKARPFRYVF